MARFAPIAAFGLTFAAPGRMPSVEVREAGQVLLPTRFPTNGLLESGISHYEI